MKVIKIRKEEAKLYLNTAQLRMQKILWTYENLVEAYIVYIKVMRVKVNIYLYVYILPMKNLRLKFLKIIIITTASKNIKYLVVNLTKDVWRLLNCKL